MCNPQSKVQYSRAALAVSQKLFLKAWEKAPIVCMHRHD